MTVKSAKDLVAKANRTVETLTAEDAQIHRDPNVVFVDVREVEEVQGGHARAPRLPGVQADPTSPTQNRNWAVASGWCSIAPPATARRSERRL